MFSIYDFSWCVNEDVPKPLCVICENRLAYKAIVPNKVMCHLNTKHAVHACNKDYFQRLLSQNEKQECFMKSSFTVPKKALEAVIMLQN